MRILLVEDEPSAARFIAKGLREAAYAVDIASNGAAASQQSQQNDYDAIVLDVMLPIRDGLSVCRELRAAGMDVRCSCSPRGTRSKHASRGWTPVPMTI